MSRILGIAVREFAATCLNKAFFFGAIVMPILVYGLIIVTMTTGLFTGEKPVLTGTVAIVDTTPDQFVSDALESYFDAATQAQRLAEQEADIDAALDATGVPMPQMQRDMVKRMAASSNRMDLTLERLGADADLEAEKARVFTSDGPLMLVTIDGSVLGEGGEFTVFHRKNVNLDCVDAVSDEIKSRVVDRRLDDAAFTDEQLTLIDVLQRRPSSNFTTITEQGERDTNTVLTKALPFVFLMLLWISVMMGGQYLLMSTIEEKSTRVMEVLLSAVSPLNLMIGKILGQAAVGLLWLGMYSTLGIGAAAQFGFLADIDLSLLVWLVVYFVMAYLMFASLFAAAGSAVTDIREANAFVTPIMLLLMVPFMLMIPLNENPESVLAHALSYFPPTTPFVMVIRMAQPSSEVTLFQFLTTSLVGFAGVFALMWVAAKIFRVGVLMYGQPPSPMEMLKWLRYS